MAIATPLTHDPAAVAAAAVPVAEAAARLRLRDGAAVTLRTGEAGTAGDERATISAQAEGRTVGAASYARVYGPRAVLTLEVDDGFWHRGLPELLLTALCARAAQLGIATFLMRVPAGDVRLLALLCQRCGARTERDGAYVDVEFAVPAR